MYLGSKELKKTIVELSFKYEMPLRFICIHAGISYKDFMATYINSVENKNFEVTQHQFEKVLDVLGIKVRHQFVITEIDYAKKRVELEEKYLEQNERKKGK